MKKILSIDGGGIRGIIPAMVLASLERRLGKPVSEVFDLVVGTSTGGILALGLTVPDERGKPRYNARELADIYQRRGREIFDRSFWKGMSSVAGLLDERYSEQGLERVLLEYMGDTSMGEALIPVMVTSYDIHDRTPTFLKSWKQNHQAVPMWQAARATSAAPTYFEPQLLNLEGEQAPLIDGGVFINSPAVSAYAEARRVFPKAKQFLLVSLGTGELTRRIDFEEARDWGKAGWMLPLLSSMFDGMADAVDYQMRHFLGSDYYRFQIRLSKGNDDMDDASATNIEALESRARSLIRSRKTDLEELCQRLG